MSRIFAIPDIHGRVDLLTQLLDTLTEKHDFHPGLDKLIFLGDYVDRGPDSAAVIQKVRGLVEGYPGQVIALAGNHEWLMIDGLAKGGDHLDLWLMNGGGTTLRSYGVSDLEGTSPGGIHADASWLAALPLFHEEPGFFFSHAPIPKETRRKTWNRGKDFTKEEYIWTYGPDEKNLFRQEKRRTGVCGHIHALGKQLPAGLAPGPRLYDQYIFADAGCGCHPTAPLVAIEVHTRQVIHAWPAEAMGTRS